jgi:hypothetical protein
LDNIPNTDFEEKRIAFIEAASAELEFNGVGRLASMKRALALAAAFGAGVAVGGILSVAILSFWTNRPTPWNRNAVSASFDSVDTEGSEHKLMFVYILTNNTDRDFRIDSDADVRLTGRLQRQAALTSENSKDVLTADLPLFVPAKERARMVVHLGYAYEGSIPLSQGTSKADREKNEKAVTAFVRDELSNLDGFVVFHEPTHYQINLPSGWKK